MPSRRVKLLIALRHGLRGSDTYLLLAMAVLVGTITGVGAMLFLELIEHANHFFFHRTDEVLGETFSVLGIGDLPIWTIFIPMLGGLLAGPIIYGFAKEAKGHGVPEVMNAVARLGGIIRPRVAVAKSAASALCIGSGGSAGTEGPIVQIGAALGSTIGQVFRMPADRVKILVGCGAAAGISAVFNAPIAGVIFSLEVILGDFNIKTFSPVIIASVMASVVSRSLLGDHPAFDVPDYALVSAWEVPLYAVLGIVCGAVAVGFIRSLDFAESRFDGWNKMPNWLKPAIGGLLLGALGLAFPQVLGSGYETISSALFGHIEWTIMLALIGAKILATCLTLGSGNSGGIFAPSLYMGAVAGGAFGVLVNTLFPGVTASPGAYALVGMAGLVAGTTHAPITAILMIFEMTSDYSIMLPLMVSVVFATLIARRLFPHTIYTVKLIKRGIDIRHGRDINILRNHRVRELMDRNYQSISAGTTLAEILQLIATTNESYFLVTDGDQRLRGVISLQDIRKVLADQETLSHLVVAQDLVIPGAVVLTPDQTLEDAQEVVASRGFGLVPVVDSPSEHRLLGVLRRDRLVEYYNRELLDAIKE